MDQFLEEMAADIANFQLLEQLPTDMASSPLNLSSLPEQFWSTMCDDLEFKDMAELYNVGGNIKAAVEQICSMKVFTFRVYTEEHEEGATLSPTDHRSLESIGRILRTVDLSTNHYIISRSTFRVLQRSFASSLSAVWKLSVIVDPEFGVEFLVCEDRLGSTWGELLCRCHCDSPVEVGIKITVHICDPYHNSVPFLFGNLQTDARCYYAYHLCLLDPYPTEQEMVRWVPSLAPSPSAHLLSQFPNITHLGLERRTLVKDVLKQLATTNNILESIDLYTKPDPPGLPPVNLSWELWQNLKTACSEQFQVDCHFDQSYLDGSIQDLFRKTLKKNVPLSTVRAVLDDESGLKETLRCCSVFVSTLTYVDLRVRSLDYSPRCQEMVRVFMERFNGTQYPFPDSHGSYTILMWK